MYFGGGISCSESAGLGCGRFTAEPTGGCQRCFSITSNSHSLVTGWIILWQTPACCVAAMFQIIFLHHSCSCSKQYLCPIVLVSQTFTHKTGRSEYISIPKAVPVECMECKFCCVINHNFCVTSWII